MIIFCDICNFMLVFWDISQTSIDILMCPSEVTSMRSVNIYNKVSDYFFFICDVKA